MAEQHECAKDDSSSQQECTAVDDNLHWPYASAEDEQRDNAAGLSAPQVEGMCVYRAIIIMRKGGRGREWREGGREGGRKKVRD